jgi:hypothetical protein
MDAAHVMAGNKREIVSLNYMISTWSYMTHCMINYESLVMEELCPELSKVTDTVIRSVNYIKTCPLKSRLFAEMGTQYQSLLFYSNSCWLSRGNVMACVYNLQVAAALFL